MNRLDQEMNEIKVESHEDCVWYVKDADRCKLPGSVVERFSKCSCKNGEMKEFCIWITKFLKSACADGKNLEDVGLPNDLDLGPKWSPELYYEDEKTIVDRLMKILGMQ
jgi:hypothetical protein